MEGPDERVRPMIPVAAFAPRSRVNGPGLRAVVWVQGCPLRCPGCFNPQFLSFKGGSPTAPSELVARILADAETEGVTFSGGEPFAHAAGLATVAAAVRGAGKSVVVFTGYPRRNWEHDAAPELARLVAHVDLLIAGPYDRDRPSDQPLLASANQEIMFLTGRYRTADVASAKRCTEIRLTPSGVVTMSGFPSQELRDGVAGLGVGRATEQP